MYICKIYRNTSVVLPSGDLYIGSTGLDQIPHGWGTEFNGMYNIFSLKKIRKKGIKLSVKQNRAEDRERIAKG